VARERRFVTPLIPSVPTSVVALVVSVGLLAGCGGDLDLPVPEAATSTTDDRVDVSTTTSSTLPLVSTTSTTLIDPVIDPPVPVADPGPPPGRNSVFVIGDSVFLGTASTIPVRLSDWVVTYDAEPNRRLAQGIDVLATRRGEIGEAVVIGLGNNYIDGERGDYATQIDETMAVIADVPRVVWVTVAEQNPGRDAINEAIRGAGERYDNVYVADWAALHAAEPELSWDGIHLTPAGRQQRAELIARGLGPVDP
jgi:hypothetical protein